MIFKTTQIAGVFLIELERHEDERGFFARSFCVRDFASHGLETRFVQSSISSNTHKATLRGLHYQAEPHGEAKLVQVTRGRLFDVVLDVRPDSPTFEKWASFELNSRLHQALYLPRGVAHGFQTLEDQTEVFYQMSEFYHPESARTVPWNDARFATAWPLPNPILSSKDAEASIQLRQDPQNTERLQ